jgi:hypothetical protein
MNDFYTIGLVLGIKEDFYRKLCPCIPQGTCGNRQANCEIDIGKETKIIL